MRRFILVTVLLVICTLVLYPFLMKGQKDEDLASMLQVARQLQLGEYDLGLFNEHWIEVSGKGDYSEVQYMTKNKYHLKHGSSVYYILDVKGNIGYIDESGQVLYISTIQP